MSMEEEEAFTVQNPLHPYNEQQRADLNEHVSSLLPEDDVLVYTHKKERSLSVVERWSESDNRTVPVEWSDRKIEGYAVKLTGDDRPYLIVGTVSADEDPTLLWPRNRGVSVYGVTVTDREDEVYAEQTAKSLMQQVGIHDGR